MNTDIKAQPENSDTTSIGERFEKLKSKGAFQNPLYFYFISKPFLNGWFKKKNRIAFSKHALDVGSEQSPELAQTHNDMCP